MKNLRLLLFFLTMSASLCGWCYDFEKGGIYFNILSEQDKTVEVTGYEEECSEYSIPAEVNGYAIISIGAYAFSENEELKSVDIPSSMKTIGKGAFRNCKNLTAIEIPSSVTTLEERVFYGCEALASVIIQNGVTTIGKEAFFGCKGLTSINIPGSVTTIAKAVFSGCI